MGSLECCNAFEAETNDTLAEIQKRFSILAAPSSKGSGDSKPGTAPSTVGSAPPTGSLAELRTLSHIKGMAGLAHSRIADKSDFKSLRQEIVNILGPVKDLVKVWMDAILLYGAVCLLMRRTLCNHRRNQDRKNRPCHQCSPLRLIAFVLC